MLLLIVKLQLRVPFDAGPETPGPLRTKVFVRSARAACKSLETLLPDEAIA